MREAVVRKTPAPVFGSESFTTLHLTIPAPIPETNPNREFIQTQFPTSNNAGIRSWDLNPNRGEIPLTWEQTHPVVTSPAIGGLLNPGTGPAGTFVPLDQIYYGPLDEDYMP